MASCSSMLSTLAQLPTGTFRRMSGFLLVIKTFPLLPSGINLEIMSGSPSALSNTSSHSCEDLEIHWRADSTDSSTPDDLASGSLAIIWKLSLIVSAFVASIQKILQKLLKSVSNYALNNSG